MELQPLRELVERLTAEDGCPWDRRQTPASLGIYLVEEVFELVDAIDRNDPRAIAEELGDVLFQIVFMVFLLEKSGILVPAAVVQQNVDKMVRRHPHVFGQARLSDAGQVRRQWQEIKRAEKKEAREEASLLDGVPAGLPALLKAYRISQRAAAAGFDWDDLEGVMSKAREEWAEMEQEFSAGGTGTVSRRFVSEFGDLLFTLVNVARLAGFHPETALDRAVAKFSRRFRKMEQLAAEIGKCVDRLAKDQLEQLWRRVKEGEVSEDIDHPSGVE